MYTTIAATNSALRSLARRVHHLDEEFAALDGQLATLVQPAALKLLAVRGVGVRTAGTLLTAAGDNPSAP